MSGQTFCILILAWLAVVSAGLCAHEWALSRWGRKSWAKHLASAIRTARR